MSGSKDTPCPHCGNNWGCCLDNAWDHAQEIHRRLKAEAEVKRLRLLCESRGVDPNDLIITPSGDFATV